MGRALASARGFLPGAEQVLESFTLIAQARALKREPLSLPIGGLTDVRALLDRAARGALLEPRELIAVTACLFAFEKTLETLRARKEHLPQLLAVAASCLTGPALRSKKRGSAPGACTAPSRRASTACCTMRNSR
jgi:dsDNA-specific endonuclease/ATPase MutS2